MICSLCGFDNPESDLFCRSCGAKIDYADDVVETTLREKYRHLAALRWERQTRYLLVLAIGALLLALTLKFLYRRSTWPKTVSVPGAAWTNPASRVDYEIVPHYGLEKFPAE